MISVKAGRHNARAIARAKNARRNLQKGIANALHEIGAENVRHVRKLIYSPPKTGRIYIINGRRHQASAPGEAPANLTGSLAKSADYKVTGSAFMEFGEREEYGRYLEDGTTNIAPRPHVFRTVRERGVENARILKTAGRRL